MLASDVLFIAGVAKPPLMPYWGDDTGAAVKPAAAHSGAWLTTVWLLSLSIVAAAAAVELLPQVVDSPAARIGRGLYMIGATLGLASTTYDLAVTSTLLNAKTLPDWYLGAALWANGPRHRLLRPTLPHRPSRVRSRHRADRAMARWTAVVFATAAVLLLGHYAVFRGAFRSRNSWRTS